MVVITCQKNGILPWAITTNRCGKGRSKEEVRRQKVDGNDRTTGLQDYRTADDGTSCATARSGEKWDPDGRRIARRGGHKVRYYFRLSGCKINADESAISNCAS